jgi:hypothetical protein
MRMGELLVRAMARIARSIEQGGTTIDQCSAAPLSGRAHIDVLPLVVDERLARERAIVSFRLVDDGNVQRDPLLIHFEVGCRAMAVAAASQLGLGPKRSSARPIMVRAAPA